MCDSGSFVSSVVKPWLSRWAASSILEGRGIQ